MIILFAMIFGWGGNGFGFGNRGPASEPVTEAGLCNAMNFNGLENAVGRLSDRQAAIARQNDNAVCSLGYQTLEQSGKLGATVRRFGCNAVLSGNGVLLKGQGYFDADAGVTFTPTAAGAYTVTLFKDGVAVPGATQTITAAAAGTVSVDIPAIVRNQCRDSTSTLTLVIASATVPVTVTIDDTAVVVTKL